mmetsp:Transcript_11876/g.20238  ORF Transcript_11876/g.20238 Transcript_11876/m.20238 type:complete len:859 (+) Transcript_11876:96-2672(+)
MEHEKLQTEINTIQTSLKHVHSLLANHRMRPADNSAHVSPPTPPSDVLDDLALQIVNLSSDGEQKEWQCLLHETLLSAVEENLDLQSECLQRMADMDMGLSEQPSQEASDDFFSPELHVQLLETKEALEKARLDELRCSEELKQLEQELERSKSEVEEQKSTVAQLATQVAELQLQISSNDGALVSLDESERRAADYKELFCLKAFESMFLRRNRRLLATAFQGWKSNFISQRLRLRKFIELDNMRSNHLLAGSLRAWHSYVGRTRVERSLDEVSKMKDALELSVKRMKDLQDRLSLVRNSADSSERSYERLETCFVRYHTRQKRWTNMRRCFMSWRHTCSEKKSLRNRLGNSLELNDSGRLRGNNKPSFDRASQNSLLWNSDSLIPQNVDSDFPPAQFVQEAGEVLCSPTESMGGRYTTVYENDRTTPKSDMLNVKKKLAVYDYPSETSTANNNNPIITTSTTTTIMNGAGDLLLSPSMSKSTSSPELKNHSVVSLANVSSPETELKKSVAVTAETFDSSDDFSPMGTFIVEEGETTPRVNVQLNSPAAKNAASRYPKENNHNTYKNNNTYTPTMTMPEKPSSSSTLTFGSSSAIGPEVVFKHPTPPGTGSTAGAGDAHVIHWDGADWSRIPVTGQETHSSSMHVQKKPDLAPRMMNFTTSLPPHPHPPPPSGRSHMLHLTPERTVSDKSAQDPPPIALRSPEVARVALLAQVFWTWRTYALTEAERDDNLIERLRHRFRRRRMQYAFFAWTDVTIAAIAARSPEPSSGSSVLIQSNSPSPVTLIPSNIKDSMFRSNESALIPASLLTRPWRRVISPPNMFPWKPPGRADSLKNQRRYRSPTQIALALTRLEKQFAA